MKNIKTKKVKMKELNVRTTVSNKEPGSCGKTVNDFILLCKSLVCAGFLVVLCHSAHSQVKSQYANAVPRTKIVKSISELKKSIVQIQLVRQSNDMSLPQVLSTGSGFVVGEKGHIMTNHHVIKGAVNDKSVKIMVAFAFQEYDNRNSGTRVYNNYMMFYADIIDIDKENDLALIKVDENWFTRITPAYKGKQGEIKPQISTKIKFVNRVVQDGEQIIVTGYPLAFNTVINNVGYVSSSATADRRYFADMRVNHGNSGGPVYLSETGEIIGVAVALETARIVISEDYLVPCKKSPADSLFTMIPLSQLPLSYNSGLSHIVSIEHVKKIMLKNKIKLPN